MKSFKEYLTESQENKKYCFKLKVAGSIPENFNEVVEAALEKYGVEKFNKGKTSPIQAKLIDFPTIENDSMTVYDVELNYPTTSSVLTNYIVDQTGITSDRVKVQSPGEEAEAEINDEHSTAVNTKPLLLTPDPKKECNQHLVGEKKISNFLKELSKVQKDHQPQQYKGVNDELLAKKLPKGEKE